MHVRVSESKRKNEKRGGERGENRAKAVSNNFAVASAGAGISGFRAGSGLSNYSGLCRDMQEARCRLFRHPGGQTGSAAAGSEPCHPGVRRAESAPASRRVCAGSGELVPAGGWAASRLCALPGRGPSSSQPPPLLREPRPGAEGGAAGGAERPVPGGRGSKRAAAQARVGPRRGRRAMEKPHGGGRPDPAPQARLRSGGARGRRGPVKAARGPRASSNARPRSPGAPRAAPRGPLAACRGLPPAF